MSSEKTLLKAALSHLELAMKNICEQTRQYELATDDRSFILMTATTLEDLASRLESNKKYVTGSSLQAAVSDSSPILRFQSKCGSMSSTQVSDSSPISMLSSARPQAGEADSRLQPFEKFGASPRSIQMDEGDQEEAFIETHKTGLSDIYPTMTVNTGNGADVIACSSRIHQSDIYPTSTTPELEEVQRQDAVRCMNDDMLKIMQDEFELLDRDNDGAVTSKSLKQLCVQLGFRRHHIGTVFSSLEKTHDGLIFQEEWRNIANKILASHDKVHIAKIVNKQRSIGIQFTSSRLMYNHVSPNISFASLMEGVKHRQHLCILSYKSNTRMMWDLLMIAVLFYISICLPLSFAFSDVVLLEDVDKLIDWLFIVDVLLNFRTTYKNRNCEEVWLPVTIAKHYLRTWFLLDLTSAFPFEWIFADVANLHAAKLLKVGKVAKAIKLLRLGKLFKIWEGSEFVERFEEFVWESNLLLVRRGWIMLIQMAFVSHWTACLLLACGGDATLSHDSKSKYLVAMYWATMTVTTVGYGDVPMESDMEKIYAIIAMIVGGAFYGYIIGVVTTIISQLDINQRAFTEQMDVVVLWLNNHTELSDKLRRRIWRHFKEFLTSKKAVDDVIILNDLPPQLLSEVSVALLKESVRANPLFQGLSCKALSSIAGTISEVKFQPDEVVINKGDAGKAMFIVERGFLHLEKDGKNRQLCAFDSFGEELLMSEAKHYEYTVKTHSKATMFRITRDSFHGAFQDQGPDVLLMKKNFETMSLNRHRIGLHATTGAASLLSGGPQGISPSSPNEVLEEVFEQLTDLTRKLDRVCNMQLNVEHACSALLQERIDSARRREPDIHSL